MSENTPNSKGPVQQQMSPELAASLGLTPTAGGTASDEPQFLSTSEVNPEDIGTLSIEYRDGAPVILVSGGPVIPASLPVVDASGNAVASYAAGAAERDLESRTYAWYRGPFTAEPRPPAQDTTGIQYYGEG
ncbi:hypothetical protein ACFV1F_22375 [Streptomyces sp. NPDC059590]|uniref:hypothetical protein n=1 Tax=Streptomyces sp. NPDC059590 TaxID=3346877 RepID=UPI0036A9EF48